MRQPSPEFACACLARALLDQYSVTRAPVPVQDMLRLPPPDLSRHISLTEGLPFGDALWTRTVSGQGVVMVSSALNAADRRQALARLLFFSLCLGETGPLLGPHLDSPAMLNRCADLFVRHLLLPPELLPGEWRSRSIQELAGHFEVPPQLMQAHLQTLRRAGAARGG